MNSSSPISLSEQKSSTSLSERVLVFLGSRLGALLLRLIAGSIRWRNVGCIGQEFWSREEPAIFVFWHSDQLLMPWIYNPFKTERTRLIHALISQHRDGRIIAETIGCLGLGSVAGSSTRGGKAALKKMTRLIKRKEHVGITPDGPKGPVNKVKAGAISLAQFTGAPIYAMGMQSRRAWTFKSWDRMFLPKPFTTCARGIIGPIEVPRTLSESDLHEYQLKVESLLSELKEQLQKEIR